MKADLPLNEVERLAALYSYDVVDTGREESFDDLTRLAAFVCRAPIAAISLTEDTREWFKSSLGAEFTETPIEEAFSAYAILNPVDPLIVPDASQDDRFKNNRLVTGPPGIRFYAGVPLVDAAGFPLGIISVIDIQPREIDQDQVNLLRLLARQTIAQIQLRKANSSLRRQSQALERVREDAVRTMRGQAGLLRSTALDVQAGIQTALRALNDAGNVRAAIDQLDLSNRTLSLVGDVVDLEVARTLRPAVKVDARGLFQTVVQEVGVQASVHPEEAMPVVADAFALSTLFRCLLVGLPQGSQVSAAFAFGTKGGKPTIRLNVQVRHSVASDLAVEPFGIQAARRIAELLDGSFDSESGLQHVHLNVEIPVRNSAASTLDEAIQSVDRRTGARVLVAEDNQVNVMVIQAMLEERGYEVDCVETGREALEQVLARDYDLVLMDIQMPELDGLEATRMIRRQGGKYRDLPIIALTANATEEDRQACLDAGMNDYISKPYKPVTLTETLQRWGLTRT